MAQGSKGLLFVQNDTCFHETNTLMAERMCAGMAYLWGKKYSKDEIRKYTGDISQIAGAKSYELKDGKAFGVRAVDVKTGSGLEFTVLPDRGMDIAWATYKGKPLCLITKNGIVSSKYYEPQEEGFHRSFFGGLLTTCGLSNTGAHCEVDGVKYGMHGRISNTPAERVNIEEHWDEDSYKIQIKGQVRESSFYGENLLMTRHIETALGEKRFSIYDTIENQGYSQAPLMLLYHFNIGFPILDHGSELLINSRKTDYYDEASQKGGDSFSIFQHPTHGYFRQVFFHSMKEDAEGNTMCAVVNRDLDCGVLGLYIKFNLRQLPELFEFKMMGESDFLVGLEPGNCMPMGRAVEKEQGRLKYIMPGEKKTFRLEIGIIEGKKELDEILKYIRMLA